VSLVIRRFLADDGGATAIEYAFIASLIAIAIIASVATLGSNLQNSLTEVTNDVK
jgi:pilus assembly protein Flp/PilA